MEPGKARISCADYVLPNLERLSPQEPIVDRLQEVTAEAKQILSESI
jgi:hypothetical protein